MRAEGNLADLCMTQDLPGAEAHCETALMLARRWGARDMEAFAAGNLMYVLTMTGRFDEAFRLGAELLQAGSDMPGVPSIHGRLAVLEALAGHQQSAEEYLASSASNEQSDDMQERAMCLAARAAVALARHDYQVALDAAGRAVDGALGGGVHVAHEAVRQAFPDALDAALAIPDLDRGERLVELLANARQVRFRLFSQPRSSAIGHFSLQQEMLAMIPKRALVASENAFRELGYPYWVARAQLDRAEWLARRDNLEESAELVAEAASTFERLGATPMLARVRMLLEAEIVRKPDAEGERAVAQSHRSTFA